VRLNERNAYPVAWHQQCVAACNTPQQSMPTLVLRAEVGSLNVARTWQLAVHRDTQQRCGPYQPLKRFPHGVVELQQVLLLGLLVSLRASWHDADVVPSRNFGCLGPGLPTGCVQPTLCIANEQIFRPDYWWCADALPTMPAKHIRDAPKPMRALIISPTRRRSALTCSFCSSLGRNLPFPSSLCATKATST